MKLFSNSGHKVFVVCLSHPHIPQGFTGVIRDIKHDSTLSQTISQTCSVSNMLLQWNLTPRVVPFRSAPSIPFHYVPVPYRFSSACPSHCLPCSARPRPIISVPSRHFPNLPKPNFHWHATLSPRFPSFPLPCRIGGAEQFEAWGAGHHPVVHSLPCQSLLVPSISVTPIALQSTIALPVGRAGARRFGGAGAGVDQPTSG